MIRMYSRKYFCPHCKNKDGSLKRLYGERNQEGERTLNCEIHGFVQYCNCSPSDFDIVVIPDDEE